MLILQHCTMNRGFLVSGPASGLRRVSLHGGETVLGGHNGKGTAHVSVKGSWRWIQIDMRLVELAEAQDPAAVDPADWTLMYEC